MPKVRVAVLGTIGKSVLIDTDASARLSTLESVVETLRTQTVAGGIASGTAHSSLSGLQVGDDHPQYALWAAAENITGPWNFENIPTIQGESLAEYIEDVVGGDFFDFLQDTSSVVWTYHETAGELEANVPPEFVQDTVGAMLTDTLRINLDYNDGAGTFSADLFTDSVDNTFLANMAQDRIKGRASGAGTGDPTDLTAAQVVTLLSPSLFANPSASIGLAAVNGSASTAMRSDGAPALSQAIAPTWTGDHVFAGPSLQVSLTGADLVLAYNETDQPVDQKIWWNRVNSGNYEVQTRTDAFGLGQTAFRFVRSGTTVARMEIPNDGQELTLGASNDLRIFHNGTNSFVRNDTGYLGIMEGATEVARFDTNATAGNTRFLVYDVDNGTLERVSVGAADSGGTGFKVLRIPN